MQYAWGPMKTAQSNWQHELANVITDIRELAKFLDWDETTMSTVSMERSSFPLRVPHSFVARMRKNDLQDPLLLQVLFQPQEQLSAPGYSTNPLQENQFNPIPGLLHKYQGRVLLIMTGACAINCRYCFRRHFPYSAQLPNKTQWQVILNYIAGDDSIEEVILSGGEPLLLKDTQLQSVLEDLSKITHLKWLRIHTRMPVVIPQRITNTFISVLQHCHLRCTIVIHSNHPNEISVEVQEAMRLLQRQSITVLNQSVLLKGINDDARVLSQLSKILFSCGVLPYYCHFLDPVQGAAHFFVTKSKGLHIMQILQKTLPGYLVPRLVFEKPGAASKLNLSGTESA